MSVVPQLRFVLHVSGMAKTQSCGYPPSTSSPSSPLCVVICSGCLSSLSPSFSLFPSTCLSISRAHFSLKEKKRIFSVSFLLSIHLPSPLLPACFSICVTLLSLDSVLEVTLLLEAAKYLESCRTHVSVLCLVCFLLPLERGRLVALFISLSLSHTHTHIQNTLPLPPPPSIICIFCFISTTLLKQG